MPTISRPLSDKALRFQLFSEGYGLWRGSHLARSGRAARTLVKDGPIRVAVIALGPRGAVAEHHADGPITIQALTGRVAVRLETGTQLLEPGDLLSLPTGARHAVESDSGGVFLLTVVSCAP